MADVIRNVLDFAPQNLQPGVYALTFGLWILLVIATLWSILLQPITRPAKFFWAAVTIFLPLVGALAYCGFCLPRADWGPLEGFKATMSITKPKTVASRSMRAGGTVRGTGPAR